MLPSQANAALNTAKTTPIRLPVVSAAASAPVASPPEARLPEAPPEAPPPDVDALLKGDSFCIKPWVHCHVNTQGDVRPCCVAPLSYGNVQAGTLEQIWQGPEIRRFRVAHLSGQKVRGCERCYAAEKVGAFSMRKNANEYFAARARDWVATTTRDGHAPEARRVDYDIRFSNICNFKCRSCYHGASSSWYKDHVAVHGAPNGPKAILRAFDTPAAFWGAFGSFVDDVEKVYFAGGEPLLQDEHYEVLRALHERGRHDVFLFYNTNFSVLDYRGTNVTELWRHFQRITVAASLDASGARAELIRSGQSWQRALSNRARLARECPNVDFRVACTVSALNAWHLPDFHRELIESGYIQPAQFDINVAQYPTKLSVQVLPAELKVEIEARLLAHMAWLRARGEHEAAARFEPVRQFLRARDESALLPQFRAYCRQLDGLRGENTAATFPELASIWSNAQPLAAAE